MGSLIGYCDTGDYVWLATFITDDIALRSASGNRLLDLDTALYIDQNYDVVLDNPI